MGIVIPAVCFLGGVLTGVGLTLCSLRVLYLRKKKPKPIDLSRGSRYTDINFLDTKFKDAGNF